MEKQPANTFEERMGRMVQALRDEPMPAVASDVLTYTARLRRVWPASRWLALGGGLAAIAAVILFGLPREASAALMIGKIAKAGDEAFRHETYYHLRPDGKWTVERDIYIGVGSLRLIERDGAGEMLVTGGNRYDYDKHKGFVTVEKLHSANPTELYYRASLRRQLSLDPTAIVTRAGAATWKGKPVEKYKIHSVFIDALGQQLTSDVTLYADPDSDRPYYEEVTTKGGAVGQFVSGQTNAIEWEYPSSVAGVFGPTWPAGTPIYDPERLREQVKEELTGRVRVTSVAGVEVILRGVYTDPYGLIHVFTTGGTGRVERGATLKVDGRAAGETFSAGQNHGHWAGGSYAHGGAWVFEPLHYRGLDLVYQAASFGRDYQFRDTIDLDVPVWRADHSKVGRSFVGYAHFDGITPVRIAGQVLAVNNGSILWSAADHRMEDPNWSPTHSTGARAIAQ